MSLCKHCITNVRHEGTPTGKVEEINGVKAYVALPKSDYHKTRPSSFHRTYLASLQSTLSCSKSDGQADDFARNGFQVYVADYLNDDPVLLDTFATGKFDLEAWLSNHGVDKTRPRLDKLINVLKAKGITTFGAVGYCFGGRYVFDLAFDGAIKVAVVSHPSLLEVEHLEKYKKTGIPLLINSCEIDPVFGAEKQKAADVILGDGKTDAPGYKRTYCPRCTHGFAVRGDVSDPLVKAGREGVFKATVVGSSSTFKKSKVQSSD